MLGCLERDIFARHRSCALAKRRLRTILIDSKVLSETSKGVWCLRERFEKFESVGWMRRPNGRYCKRGGGRAKCV